MAEVPTEKPSSLAEQYSLQEIEKADQVGASVDETPVKENPADTSSGGVVAEKTSETPAEVVAEKDSETPSSEVVAEKDSETPSSEVVAENNDQIPVAEEAITVEATNNETSEEPETEVEPAEEKPEIKLETAPADFRFPTTNQTRHCFTRYIEYHRCIAAKGEDAPECNKFAKYYRSLCPSEWVERWNEQRENGTFPGPL
ncbi:cytochrome c oxidase subunit 6b-1-like [Canna indica]|uniref:Cytochrome c oxidase subunit 6b-1-like n=1 Tax=Canna indica TaxID=4628 RepID=A0AAQ3JQ98_9LILI|nr:cytochrome c oxidase subunit 6b-1-like [Canna indica]